MFKKVIISGDHTGQELNSKIIEFLQAKNIEFETIPLLEGEDYTDVARKTSKKVTKDLDYCGILTCGSGIGVSIVSNKQRGIRAALCHTELMASLARKHNNANVLCLGARFHDNKTQLKIINVFLNTAFEGGRHFSRVQKIENLEF